MVKGRRLAKEVNVPAPPRVVGTRSSSAMKSVTLMLMITVGCVFFFFWTYNPTELERTAEQLEAVFFSIKTCMCKVSLVRIAAGLQMVESNETFDD